MRNIFIEALAVYLTELRMKIFLYMDEGGLLVGNPHSTDAGIGPRLYNVNVQL